MIQHRLHLHRYAKRSILNAFRKVFLAATDEHICNATCTPNETKCLRINTAKTWQDRYALHPVSLLQQVEGVNLHPEEHNQRYIFDIGGW